MNDYSEFTTRLDRAVASMKTALRNKDYAEAQWHCGDADFCLDNISEWIRVTPQDQWEDADADDASVALTTAAAQPSSHQFNSQSDLSKDRHSLEVELNGSENQRSDHGTGGSNQRHNEGRRRNETHAERSESGAHTASAEADSVNQSAPAQVVAEPAEEIPRLASAGGPTSPAQAVDQWPSTYELRVAVFALIRDGYTPEAKMLEALAKQRREWIEEKK